MDRAILVMLDPPNLQTDWIWEELRQLADSAGATVISEFHQRRSRPDPAYFIGRGKAEELYEEVQSNGATLVIFGEDLTPTQQRNLEDAVTVRVIDRTQLILDIFAQRAHTKEGKLQVELAQLEYLLPRLTGKGTEMTRLGGGIGTRGPGETKLEVDRRRIRVKITDLEKELLEVVQRRSVQKQARRKLPFPSAALVGYTSAGKSTLLNTLSGSDVLVDRRLFATLDPTTRRVVLPDGWAVLMSDTVGFIRNLPHFLVAAFRATLEEVVEADFLIHVVDASHPEMRQQMEAVNAVLAELGVVGKPVVTVFNKSDLLYDQYDLRRLVAEIPNSAYISAQQREGIRYLMDRITNTIKSLLTRVTLEIPYDRSDLVSICYESGRVISADYRTDRIVVEADVAQDVAARLDKYVVRDGSS
ncbi:MAG: GTPase HflX [Armatimonadota bacterium]|nr:GTPase HflX [Armatimonadota bacterium]